MVNVKDRRCAHKHCRKRPLGVAGSANAQFCSHHATAGMTSVVRKTCGRADSPECPSYGAAGSKKMQVLPQHATEGMVKTVNLGDTKCAHEGCSEWGVCTKHGVGMASVCRRHAAGHHSVRVTVSAGLTTGAGTSSHSSTEGDGGCDADARGTKRIRVTYLGSGASHSVGARRCVDLPPGQGDTVPPLVSGHPSLGHNNVSLKATAGAGMKVELAVLPHAGTREGMKQRSTRVALSSDRGVASGSNKASHSSDDESMRRPRGSLAVLSGQLVVCDDVESEEATECANVKLELGSSSPPL
ncbi:unnamed protein product [Sphacelaria rigidula]